MAPPPAARVRGPGGLVLHSSAVSMAPPPAARVRGPLGLVLHSAAPPLRSSALSLQNETGPEPRRLPDRMRRNGLESDVDRPGGPKPDTPGGAPSSAVPTLAATRARRWWWAIVVGGGQELLCRGE